MWTSIKLPQFFARSATKTSSNKQLSSEKPQVSSQVPAKPVTYQSQFSAAKDADMLMSSSYQRKLKASKGWNYSGLHDYY